jgi:DNA repair protein RecO (recombination protein O)
LEAKVGYQYSTLHSDIVKSTMAFFLAEMLSNSIFEEEANAELFSFVEAAMQWLDHNHEVSNFHLVFLVSLTKYLGFYPDTSSPHLPYFDLVEGSFIEEVSLNPLVKEDNLYYFKKVLETDFDEMHSLKMNKARRQELLKILLLYFELHLQGFRRPKSIAILNEVFS